MIIYITRHGQTDWNKQKIMQGTTDVMLNDIGREQAKVKGKYISHLNIKKIISSDLLRAKETAEIINENLNIPIEKDNRLREEGMGDLEGKFIEDIDEETWGIYRKSPEKLNAETLSSVYSRIESFFNDVRTNNDDDVLVVSHGGTIVMMTYYAEQQNGFDKEIYDNNYRSTGIDNTAILKWDTKSNKIEVVIN